MKSGRVFTSKVCSATKFVWILALVVGGLAESAVLASHEIADVVLLAWRHGFFMPISLSFSPILGLVLCPLNTAISLVDAVT